MLLGPRLFILNLKITQILESQDDLPQIVAKKIKKNVITLQTLRFKQKETKMGRELVGESETRKIDKEINGN